MKERHNSKLKRLVLTILLLFLTSFTLPAANRSATPAFGSKTITAISRTQSGEWVLGGCLKTVQLKVVMWLVFPASFRSEHGKLNTEHFLFTITQPGAVTTFTHDTAGRILTETAKDNDGTVLVADTFTYDNAGNIQHKTETRGDQTWDIDYTYTHDHRLTGYTIKQGHTTLQTVAFQYDEAGNRTKETRTENGQTTTIEYTYNNFNQLTSSKTSVSSSGTQPQTVSYEYDQGGRLTAEHAETAEGEESKEYGYNPFGNLISVASTTPQATSEAAYTYSYDGKRISKYIDGTLYDYTYTGSNLLETYADTAGRIAKYTYGNALVSQSNATGDTHSVITDYQNSVSASVSASGGALTLFAYTPFGKLRYQSNSNSPQGLGWLGRQYDSETGNNYLINRYYSSDRGSFLSPDRYQYVNNATPFTWNLYQYAYANPLVNVDPEGLQTFSENEQGFADYSKAVRIWKKISAGNPRVTLEAVRKALSKYRFTKSGTFERYIYTQQLPEDFTGVTTSLYHTDKGYLFKEGVVFNKEGQLCPTLTPVEITMKDGNEFRRVPGLGEFWEGLTFNSMSSDATRLYRNADGSFNIGFILGHTLQVGLDVLTTGEFKTRTPAVEVEKLSDLSLHTSSYVNTDVPVLNKLLSDGGVMGMGSGEREFGTRFQHLLRKVREADFSTPPDGAVFWTGYREGNQALAMEWARKNGKMTIEMTKGGEWLTEITYGPNAIVTKEEAKHLWREGSVQFVMSASGRVNVFSAGVAFDRSKVFFGLELKKLRKNPRVYPVITYRGY